METIFLKQLFLSSFYNLYNYFFGLKIFWGQVPLMIDYFLYVANNKVRLDIYYDWQRQIIENTNRNVWYKFCYILHTSYFTMRGQSVVTTDLIILTVSCFLVAVTVKGDTWHMTRDTWHMTHATWHIVWDEHSINISAP